MEKALLYSNILLWVIQAGVIFCLLMVFRQFGEVYLKSADAISRDGIPIGDTIPHFEGFSLPNLRKITSEEIQGRPTLLAFISPNCGACKDMIPDWNEAYRKYGHKVNFVLMGTGKEEEYNPFLKERQVFGLLFGTVYGMSRTLPAVLLAAIRLIWKKTVELNQLTRIVFLNKALNSIMLLFLTYYLFVRF